MRTTLFVAILSLVPGAGLAANVAVNCPGGSINTALSGLDLIGPHTITVTGTCMENVGIFARDRVTIQAPDGQTASIVAFDATMPAIQINGRNIVLRRLRISGGSVGVSIDLGSTVQMIAVSVEDNTGPGIRARNESFVLAGGSTASQAVEVRNNGGAGFSSDASTLIVGGFVTAEDNAGFGISVNGGRLVLIGDQGDNIVRNNNGGVNIRGALADFNGRNVIQSNGNTGVQVQAAAFASFNATMQGARATTIEGHANIGLHIAASAGANLLGAHTIRNNGAGGPSDATGAQGGVNVGTTSRVQIGGGTEITNNTGPGLTSRFNGAISIADTTIANNTEAGLLVIRQSVAGLAGGNTIAGNGRANVSCDTTALVFGDLAGVTDIKCMKVERELGPPRPGAITDIPK